VSFCQRLVHLSQDQALSSLSWAHKAYHEFLFNAEAKNPLDIGSDYLKVHKCNHAVLEDVSTQLINMLALVFKRLLKSGQLDFLPFPLFAVVGELFCNNTCLASSFDYVFNLGFMNYGVVNSVSLTVFNADVFQNRGKSHGHSLQLRFRQSLQTLFFQVMLGIDEELVFFALVGQLGISRISFVKVCLNLNFKKLHVLNVLSFKFLNLFVPLFLFNCFLSIFSFLLDEFLCISRASGSPLVLKVFLSQSRGFFFDSLLVSLIYFI